MRKILSLFLILMSINFVFALEISNIEFYRNTPDSAEINWNTDIPSDSKIYYDKTKESMSLVSGSAGNFTIHGENLYGLDPDSAYFFEIISCDAEGICDMKGLFELKSPNQGISPTYLYGGIIAVLVLIILYFLLRKKKSPQMVQQ